MRVGFVIPDRVYPWAAVHLGIGYVASFAVSKGLVDECAVFRSHGRSGEELQAFLERSWDVLGLTLTEDAVEEANEINLLTRKLATPPLSVLGGAYVTTHQSLVFEQLRHTDFAVVGEGERTFCELLRCLRGEGELADVAGLLYRDSNGSIRENPRRPWEEDLDVFPPPDRSLFTYPYDYHSIIGTRGCPFSCTFCNSSANWGRHYRVRRPASIAAEIRAVIDRYGDDKYFEFCDDAFNLRKQWVLEVCNEIASTGARWWIRGIKAELIDAEVADALASSNCIGGACGVESADNSVLRRIGKGTTIERILRGAELLYSRGLCLNGQFMIGNIGDSLESVRLSIATASRFQEAVFGIACPIPHTALFDYVEKHSLFLKEPVPVVHEGRVVDYILFATPEFTVEERLEAIRLAIDAGLYQDPDDLEGPSGLK